MAASVLPSVSHAPAPGTALQVPIIEKTRFLYEPHRYKILYGGRGGLKSWSATHALLVLGMQRPLRVVCGRETQSSIRESVHQLIESRIRALDLLGFYEVLEYTIRARQPNAQGERTEFIFTGLRDQDVRNIKSLEAADVLWVEEATQVSKQAWDTIIPTIRRSGSEIWITFNPSLETDDTYKRFVLDPPPGAVVVRTYWWENPWLPDVARLEAETLKTKNFVDYLHIWEGECQSEVTGAIFAEELKLAQKEGRIGNVPVDRSKPVDTFWDLGKGDKTAIWFGQAINGWYHMVDYLEDSGHTIEHYIIQLQARGYVYGIDWLPFDGVDTILHRGLAAEPQRSIEELMRLAGRNVRIAPKVYVHERINAARTIFSQCRFDQDRCADGIQRLRHYQWQPPSQIRLESGGFTPVYKREPLHNLASHGSDAFQVFAVSAHQPRAIIPPKPRPASRNLGVWQ